MSLNTANAVWAAGLQSFMQGQPNMKIMGFVAETGSFMQPESSSATATVSSNDSSTVTFNGRPGYSIPPGGTGLIPVLSPDLNMQLFAVVENDGSTAPSPAGAAGSYTSTAENWINQLESMVGFNTASPTDNVPSPGTNDLAILLGTSPLQT